VLGKKPPPPLHKKANLTTDEHGWHGFTNSKALIELFDPWKSVLSVLSVVRFGVCAGVL
jgi:hypothetical protein